MIRVEHLTKTYKNGEEALYAVNDVSFEINDNEFVVILGPSGSGKSTLLNVVSGLEKADGGRILYDDIDITALDKKALTAFRRETTSFIFQAYYLLPTLNVTANIRMGADLVNNSDIAPIIEAVGLKGKEKRLPQELSGGEQQRVSIARAIAKKPRVLFCDEPTGALDEDTGRQIMRYLIELQKKENITVVMVTHNANFAEIATKTIRMNSGRIKSVSCLDTPKSIDEIGW